MVEPKWWREPFPWFLIDVGSAFRSLKAYVRHMESATPLIAALERERLEEEAMEEEEVGGAWHEHHWLFEEAIPRSLRYTFSSPSSRRSSGTSTGRATN